MTFFDAFLIVMSCLFLMSVVMFFLYRMSRANLKSNENILLSLKSLDENLFKLYAKQDVVRSDLLLQIESLKNELKQYKLKEMNVSNKNYTTAEMMLKRGSSVQEISSSLDIPMGEAEIIKNMSGMVLDHEHQSS